MTRINLLPPEIIEKRKFEGRITYVILGGIGVALLLVALYSFAAWQVKNKNGVLDQNQALATQLRAQANAYEIFQQKEDLLQQQLDVASTALAARIDWGRIANELSLVMPSDVWLIHVQGSEENGLEIVGYAVDSDTDVPDVGHKAVAKTLVRLADLELLDDVWLTSSQKTELEGTESRVIEFSITTGVVQSVETTDSSESVSAPPTQSQ